MRRSGDLAGPWIAAGLVALVAALSFAKAMSVTGPYWFAFYFEDDFFYYVKIADNIVKSGLSSFDGIHETNGYHPLWMLIVTGLRACLDSGSAPFFVAVLLLCHALVVAGSFTFCRMSQVLAARTGAPSHGSVPAAVLYGICGEIIAIRGMEIALLWPLLPVWTVACMRLGDEPRASRMLAVSFLTSLVFLSRLDSPLILAPFGALMACRACMAVPNRFARAIPAGLLGLLPALAYLIWNKVHFGAFVPISAQAKRLLLPGQGFGVNPDAVRHLLIPANAETILVPVGMLALTVIALPVSFMAGRRPLVTGLPYSALVAGLMVFIGYNLLTSDWPFWNWYFYGIAFVGSLGFLLILASVGRWAASRDIGLPRELPVALAIILVLAFAGRRALHGWHQPSSENALLTAALAIQRFGADHPGTYAMGDRAGFPGWLLDRPLVQLEGLVNDRAQLSEIASRTDLRRSLERQDVTYYVASDAVRSASCWVAVEPAKAGMRAPRMTGTFCEEPVLTLEAAWGPGTPAVLTQIFRVR